VPENRKKKKEKRKKKKPARSKVQNANRQANFKAVPK
jgi:hypothetical protein